MLAGCVARGSGSAPSRMWRELDRRGIAFILPRERVDTDSIGPSLKRAFGGTFIANEKVSVEDSERALEAGDADAIAFGMKFLVNPDLPRRLRLGAAERARDGDALRRPRAGLHRLSDARPGRLTLRLCVLGQSAVVTGRPAGRAVDSARACTGTACAALDHHRYWVAEHHDPPGIAGSAPRILDSAIAATIAHPRPPPRG